MKALNTTSKNIHCSVVGSKLPDMTWKTDADRRILEYVFYITKPFLQSFTNPTFNALLLLKQFFNVIRSPLKKTKELFCLNIYIWKMPHNFNENNAVT